MELKEYWHLFKRRKAIIFSIFSLSFFSHLLFSTLSQDRYKAESTILLQNVSTQERLVGNFYKAVVQEISLDSQMRIMESESFAENVLKTLHKHYPALTLDHIQKGLTITKEPDTSILRIVFKNKDPLVCVQVVNAYAKLSVEENKKASKEEFVQAKTYLIHQLQRFKKKVLEADQKLKAFDETEGTFSFSSMIEAKMKMLENDDAQLQELALQKQQNALRLQKLSSELQRIPQKLQITNAVSNPEFDEYKKQLLALSLSLEDLKQKYTNQHPKILALQQKIKSLNTMMRTRISKMVEVPQNILNPEYYEIRKAEFEEKLQEAAIESRGEVLSKRIQQLKDTLKNVSGKQLSYVSLLQEKETAGKLYDQLGSTLEQMKLSESTTRGNAQIVDAARKALPIRPLNILSLTFFLITSLGIATAITVVVELLDDRMTSSLKVKNVLNLEVLGNIPFFPTHAKNLENKDTQESFAEGFFKIAFQLRSMCGDHNAKVILFASPRQGEGKSLLSFYMAKAMANSKKKILLMDADLRRPMQHKNFNIGNTVGLSSLLGEELQAKSELLSLIEKDSLKEAPKNITNFSASILHETTDPFLYVVSGGTTSNINVAQLLEKDSLKEILNVYKQNFDYILVDSPAFLDLVDASLLAKVCDAVVFICDSLQTKKKDAFRMKQTLTSRKIKILGVLLNNLQGEEDYYYPYYYQKRKVRHV